MPRVEVHQDTDKGELVGVTVRHLDRGDDVVWVRNRRSMPVIAEALRMVRDACPEVRASKFEAPGEVLVCLSASSGEWSGVGYATGRKVLGEGG